MMSGVWKSCQLVHDEGPREAKALTRCRGVSLSLLGGGGEESHSSVYTHVSASRLLHPQRAFSPGAVTGKH